MGARHRRQRPGHAPAVAVKHRQRPQQHRMLHHRAGQGIAVTHQRRAAMMIDHALGIAGGARRIVERDGVPLVGGHLPGKFRIAAFEKFLVVDLAQPLPALRKFRVVIVDHQRLFLQQRQRGCDGGRKFAVGDQHLGVAMLQHEGNGRSVQPCVQRIQHRPQHRHAIMGFQHGRGVGQHHRHRVALFDALFGQRRGQAAAAGIEIGIPDALLAMDDGGAVREGAGGAFQEGQRRQRLVVGGHPAQPLFIGACAFCDGFAGAILGCHGAPKAKESRNWRQG